MTKREIDERLVDRVLTFLRDRSKRRLVATAMNPQATPRRLAASLKTIKKATGAESHAAVFMAMDVLYERGLIDGHGLPTPYDGGDVS